MRSRSRKGGRRSPAQGLSREHGRARPGGRAPAEKSQGRFGRVPNKKYEESRIEETDRPEPEEPEPEKTPGESIEVSRGPSSRTSDLMGMFWELPNMAIQDPFMAMREMDRAMYDMRREMERMWDMGARRSMWDMGMGDLWTTPRMQTMGTPAVDTKDTGREYVVTADLPGMNKGDIEVEVTGDRLSIRGRHKEEAEETSPEGEWVRRERRSSAFNRVIRLPEEVRADECRAEMDNGVLRVSLPKVTPKETKSRRLKVE